MDVKQLKNAQRLTMGDSPHVQLLSGRSPISVRGLNPSSIQDQCPKTSFGGCPPSEALETTPENQGEIETLSKTFSKTNASGKVFRHGKHETGGESKTTTYCGR